MPSCMSIILLRDVPYLSKTINTMKKRCFNSKRLKIGGIIQRPGTHNKIPDTAAKKWEKTSISTEAA